MSHSNQRGSIVDLLENLAPQTPVSGIQVDGYYEHATAFITLDKARGLAYFSGVGGGLVVVDISELSLIEFPGV
ncbi:hypothetical protein [Robertmurraya korlensis]|uniref:hypothetical protein n=1 Tax=Robertmurraya korlensis TaxID=519977 RepID=UPI0008249F74|nr:hypothetical protein [Robertmurraya korlensis]